MLKVLLSVSILFYATALFGAYDVKLGVYKNVKNVNANIAKIKPSKYRKSIIIDKKRNKYYLHAVIESNKEARNALHAYKRIFKDAFISKRQVPSRKVVKKVSTPTPKQENPIPKAQNTQETKNQAQTVTRLQTQVATQQVADQNKTKAPKSIVKLDAKELLADKTIYLCYEEGPKHLQERVVEMEFSKDHVTYNPLKKMSSPVKIPYLFEENNLTLELSGMKITHDLYKKGPQCLHAKSVIDGLEVNKLRYYFDKEAAEAFVAGR